MATGMKMGGAPLDPLYLSDPLSNAYFAPQEQGDGQYTLGSGNGYGFIDWSQVPGYERFSAPPSAGVSGGGDENIARALQDAGLRVYDQRQGNTVTRGVIDSDGNAIGGLQTFDVSDDSDFWKAGLLAAAVAGGAAGGLFSPGGAGGGFGAAEAGMLSGGDAGLAAAAGSGGGIGTLGTLPAVPAPLAPISAAGAVAPLTAAQLAPGLMGLALPALSAAPAAAGGGSLLSKIPGPIGKFVADNPNLSRGLFSLLGGALGGGGAFSPGGGGSMAPAGPAKQWATPIQPAAYTAPQLWNPDTPVGAMSMGAGRFLGGK